MKVNKKPKKLLCSSAQRKIKNKICMNCQIRREIVRINKVIHKAINSHQF